MEDILNNITKAQDDDGHWYWIPKKIMPRFNDRLSVIVCKDYMDCPDAFDDFNDRYDKYRTLGDPDLMPDFYKNET